MSAVLTVLLQPLLPQPPGTKLNFRELVEQCSLHAGCPSGRQSKVLCVKLINSL